MDALLKYASLGQELEKTKYDKSSLSDAQDYAKHKQEETDLLLVKVKDEYAGKLLQLYSERDDARDSCEKAKADLIASNAERRRLDKERVELEQAKMEREEYHQRDLEEILVKKEWEKDVFLDRIDNLLTARRKLGDEKDKIIMDLKEDHKEEILAMLGKQGAEETRQKERHRSLEAKHVKEIQTLHAMHQSEKSQLKDENEALRNQLQDAEKKSKVVQQLEEELRMAVKSKEDELEKHKGELEERQRLYDELLVSSREVSDEVDRMRNLLYSSAYL